MFSKANRARRLRSRAISESATTDVAVSAGCESRRELNSSDPAYYRWTQWIFLQLYRGGLAYRAEAERARSGCHSDPAEDRATWKRPGHPAGPGQRAA